MTKEELELITDLSARVKELEAKVVKLEKRKPVRRFEKPTKLELSEEFFKKGSFTCQDDADAFYNFYESKDWFVGKTKMKCWKSAVSNWMRGKKKEQKQINSNPGHYSSSEATRQRLSDTGWSNGL